MEIVGSPVLLAEFEERCDVLSVAQRVGVGDLAHAPGPNAAVLGVCGRLEIG